MTYFAIICSTKTIQSEFGGIRGINHHVTNRGKAEVMLHLGAGQSDNYQIILKLFGYDIFCNNLQCKKFKANLEVSEVLITHVTISEEFKYYLIVIALTCPYM